MDTSFAAIGSRARRANFVLSCLMLVLFAGCGGKANEESPERRFATPQSTLSTLKSAGISRDYATVADCFTDELLDLMAGQIRMAAETLRMLAPLAAAMGPEQAAQINDGLAQAEALLQKHVPSDSAGMGTVHAARGADGEKAMLREAGRAVADKRAFVAEFLDGLASSLPQPDFDSLTVTKLTTDGDAATATIFDVQSNQESTIKLRRIGRQWKVDDLGNLAIAPQAEIGPPGGARAQ